jgi:Flp pilus assembly protein CpaB
MQRNKPIIIGAAVLGIIAILLTVMSLIGGSPAPPAPNPATAGPSPTPVPVTQVVAIRNIPPRTILTPAMIQEREVTSQVQGGLTSLRDAVGKLSGDAIPLGEVITPGMIVDPLKRKKPANFAVPVGTRAIAIMVDPDETVGGIVDVGDHVDVVVVHALKYKNEADMEGETRSGRTIAQNLLVLATDPAIQQAETAAVAPPAAQPGAPVDPNAAPTPAPPPPAPTPVNPNAPKAKVRVVLAAPPQEANRLAAAGGMGEFHLTIRDPSRNEEGPIREDIEYPIYTYGRRTPQKGVGAPAAQNRAPIFQPMPPQTGMQPPISLPPAIPPTGTNEAPSSDSEVTVIRGTEKTRVIVPQQ